MNAHGKRTTAGQAVFPGMLFCIFLPRPATALPPAGTVLGVEL
jgi:hypothetical protein